MFATSGAKFHSRPEENPTAKVTAENIPQPVAEGCLRVIACSLHGLNNKTFTLKGSVLHAHVVSQITSCNVSVFHADYRKQHALNGDVTF